MYLEHAKRQLIIFFDVFIVGYCQKTILKSNIFFHDIKQGKVNVSLLISYMQKIIFCSSHNSVGESFSHALYLNIYYLNKKKEF